MSDRLTLEQLIAVRDRFGLVDEAQVEKDWYVVKALAAIMAADKGPFQLVFPGRTRRLNGQHPAQRKSEAQPALAVEAPLNGAARQGKSRGRPGPVAVPRPSAWGRAIDLSPVMMHDA